MIKRYLKGLPIRPTVNLSLLLPNLKILNNLSLNVFNLIQLGAEERYQQQQKDKQTTSEIPLVFNSQGELVKLSPKVIGMSGADPLAQLYVEGVALNPIFKWIGKTALYGLGKYGTGSLQNWARGKLISNTMNLSLRTPTNYNFIINSTDNISSNTNVDNPLLSADLINKAFESAKNWHNTRINSLTWRDRALLAGFTEDETSLLLKLLTDQLNRLKIQKPEDVVGKQLHFRGNSGENGRLGGYWQTNDNGILRLGIVINPNQSEKQLHNTLIHELGHGITYSLNGDKSSLLLQLLAKQFPLIDRMTKYNASLYPEVTSEHVVRTIPSTANNKILQGYYAEPTEMLSRGYEFMKNVWDGVSRVKRKTGKLLTFDETTPFWMSDTDSKVFRALAGRDGAKNFLNKGLAIGIPTSIFGSEAYK